MQCLDHAACILKGCMEVHLWQIWKTRRLVGSQHFTSYSLSQEPSLLSNVCVKLLDKIALSKKDKRKQARP